MKRSEAVKKIKEFLYGHSEYSPHLNEAEALLNMLEQSGMKYVYLEDPVSPNSLPRSGAPLVEVSGWEPENET